MEYNQKGNYLETRTKRKRIILTTLHRHYLTDLITALNKLSPCDGEAINGIFGILGFIKSEVEKVEIKTQKKTSESSTENDVEIIQDEPISSSFQPEIFNGSDETIVLSKLIPIKKSKIDLPAWFNNPLPLNNTESSSGPFTSYPLQSLFTPEWTRAILISALSIYENIGSIDINEIVRLISLNEPLREIPRLSLPTMVHGVQVLIDDSEALEPFYKDQADIINTVQKIVGLDRVQIMGFIGCPSRGVRYEISDDWSEYRPPSSRATVLLITDLSILRELYIIDRAGLHEWLSFASMIRKTDCSLVAFVPYPKERWPKPLQSAMKIIQWDRTTFTSTIQHTAKKSLQV